MDRLPESSVAKRKTGEKEKGRTLARSVGRLFEAPHRAVAMRELLPFSRLSLGSEVCVTVAVADTRALLLPSKNLVQHTPFDVAEIDAQQAGSGRSDIDRVHRVKHDTRFNPPARRNEQRPNVRLC